MSDVRLRWNGKRVSADVQSAAIIGLRDISEHLLTESNKTVPIETGELMRSGIADVDKEALEASVSYGAGSAAPYALRQHEDMDLRHDPGRRAKWLEKTLDEQGERMQKHVENKLRDAMR